LGRHRISTSGFAYMATETAVFAVRSAKPCFSWASCPSFLPSVRPSDVHTQYLDANISKTV